MTSVSTVSIISSNVFFLCGQKRCTMLWHDKQTVNHLAITLHAVYIRWQNTVYTVSMHDLRRLERVFRCTRTRNLHQDAHVN